jgi:hypothetical protein
MLRSLASPWTPYGRDFAASDEFLGNLVERQGTNIFRNIRALLVKYAARLGFCR